MNKEKKKDHADFQSQYHQSKNFNTEAKEDALKVKGDGEVKLDANQPLSKKDKEEIADAMDNMRERMEITPGDESNKSNNNQ